MIVIEIQIAENIFEKTFLGDTLSIGSASFCDLTPHDFHVPEPELEPLHVKIDVKDKQFFISNEANDPLVLLNDLPFGKRSLVEGDQLKIHSILISIKYLSSEVKEKSEKKDEEVPDEFSDEFSLLHQVEALEDLPIDNLSREDAREAPDVNLSIGETNETGKQEEDSQASASSYFRLVRSNRFYLLLVVILLSLAGFFFISIYLTGKEEGKEQQLQASRSVADTSMALLYAHLYDLKPNNDNWTSSEFIKNSLNHILSTKYANYPLNDFGELQYCRYMMRIYTDNNLKRFLLIAQPISELMGWVRSREAIYLDSQDMQLRLLSEIKPLNRLLQKSSLEELDPVDLDEAIKNSKFIPLSSLGSEFTPPKELSFIQPGSENRVYNAPRYYRLTEKLIDEGILLTKKKEETENRQEFFKKKYEKLSELPFLVFYTSKGIKGAMLAYQSLNELLVPHELIGYLSLEAENKMMASSHLLLVKPELAIKTDIRSGQRMGQHETIWLSLMKNLAQSRYQLLKPISDQIMLLLHQHSQAAVALFDEKFQKLITAYQKIDHEEREKIPRALEQLYGIFQQEEPHLSAKVFLSNLQLAGLETFLGGYLEKEIMNSIAGYSERQEYFKDNEWRVLDD